MNSSQRQSDDYGLLKPDAGPHFNQAEATEAEQGESIGAVHDDENVDTPQRNSTPGQAVSPVDRQISIANRSAG